ncbi:MAG: hypothetical protein KBC64_01735, partial [Simkaniaceae bacterium]|nr:hypothetical protein [Simkaniaceae bacterium]
MEGCAFGLLIAALNSISSADVSTNFLPHYIPFLSSFSQNFLFTLLVIGSIVAQGLKSLISYFNAQISTSLAIKMQTLAQTQIYQHI